MDLRDIRGIALATAAKPATLTFPECVLPAKRFEYHRLGSEVPSKGMQKRGSR